MPTFINFKWKSGSELDFPLRFRLFVPNLAFFEKFVGLELVFKLASDRHVAHRAVMPVKLK